MGTARCASTGTLTNITMYLVLPGLHGGDITIYFIRDWALLLFVLGKRRGEKAQLEQKYLPSKVRILDLAIKPRDDGTVKIAARNILIVDGLQIGSVSKILMQVIPTR